MRRRVPFLTLALLVALPLSAFGQPDDGTSIVEELGGDATGEQFTAKLFDDLIKERSFAELQMLLALLPKGADLHHHYSGSLYVETYLEWVKKAGYKINSNTLKIDRSGDQDGSVTVDELYADNALYRKLLSAWSTKDFETNGQGPPDVAFFDTFAFFGAIASYDYSDGLKRLRDRAIGENVQYIETMLSAVRFFLTRAQTADMDQRLQSETTPAGVAKVLGEIADRLEATSKFKGSVKSFVELVEKNHEDIDSDAFVMRYQTYAFRNTNPSKVFASLLAGFAAASDSELIVGVNLVGPESGVLAIRDYSLHMRMFKFLKERYSGVKVALHAGELTIGDVRPEDLRFHIREAVEIGGAQRLGHCIDLPLEDGRIKLLRRLKSEGIAVEINLTSNKFILGVEGAMHVFTLLKKNKVPMVISTDDSGVSRNNLTDEYLRLSTRHTVSYAKIKELTYNSIRYAFLPQQIKTRLKARLDNCFVEFEDAMADYAKERSED
ncbi:MAG: adenosine deaminase [Planctomycetes bacterium]|nr:adenosine deaminase [Planctomycetota bacterium]